ncbi:hypothetical protein GCM10009821_25190 [Aeromicrobium halocynthiae]|uniref:Uncharacterized protein n=1 Tax=Aeromicrobium halocynthiae TaxID=560557 RepID=A0ABP5HNL1_9ACTN
MPSTRVLLTLALALLVAGVVLVVLGLQDPQVTGWFAYAPRGDEPWRAPMIVTPRMPGGVALLWLASLVVCGVGAHRHAIGALRA